MKKRILVCDDDADTREVVSLILRKHGYEVELVENGALLIEKAKAFDPHLILLDILMPHLAGKDARALLLATTETKDIPVMILSALSNAEQIANEIGAEDFLPKPFNIKELIEKARNLIE